MDDIRFWLARVTAPLHADVDAAAGAFDVSTGSGATDLVTFLARGVLSVERALDEAGAAAVLPEWPRRRRSHMLPACASAPAVRLGRIAEVWGALYVLEGSRLGGRILARSPILASHPFFADAADRSFWGDFLARLADADRNLCDRDGMASGATAAFMAFLGGPSAERDATTTWHPAINPQLAPMEEHRAQAVQRTRSLGWS